MNRIFLFSVLAACALLSLPAGRVLAQPYTLRYSFEAGKPLQYLRTERLTALSQTQDGRIAEIRRTTEARMKVTPEASDGQSLRFVFEQDTAVVRDSSTSAATSEGVPDFENLLTRRPVRVTMTPLGQLRQAQPLVSITEGRTLPPSMTDAMLARQAMIFTVLPERPLKVGESWTDAKSDTLHPEQRSAEYGDGHGLRLSRVETTYHVDTLERVGEHECLRISWESRMALETKVLFPEHEFFNEEVTTASGTLWFAHATGTFVKITVKTERNATSAAFSKEVAIIPSNSAKEITVQLLP